MLKKLQLSALFLSLLLIATQGLSQDITQTIRGTVVDAESKFPLIGASVLLIEGETQRGVTTDVDGNYKLENVPVGRRTLKVTYIGYKDRDIQNVIVNSGKEVILNIELEESAVAMDEIVVTATQNGEPLNEMATLSVRQFSVAETDRYAGSRGDPARMASSFAGVQSFGDTGNDIIVRGNSPFSLLWRFEGINIPNPNHFKSPGFRGGAVTMLNNKYLSNSDFYTGAFPAEYGNSLGGVFDLKMRNGNNEQHEFSFLLGALGTEVIAEGPINKEKRSSYLMNYRYSTLALVLQLGIDIGTSAIPEYQDGAFRLYFPQKNGGGLSVWGLGGNYNADIITSDDISPERDLYASQDRDQSYFGGMGVVGASYTQPLDKDTYFRINMAAAYNEFNREDDLVYRQVDSAGLFVLDSIVEFQDIHFGEYKFSTTFFLNKKYGRKNVIKYGADVDLFVWDILDELRVIDSTSSLYYQYVPRYKADMTSGLLVQPYIQWKHKASPNLTINTGLHAQYFSLSNSISYIEPRFGLKYLLPNAQSIKFGTGLHTQMQPMFVYHAVSNQDYTSLINQKLDFNKSVHVVAGYDRLMSSKIRLGVETYYQYIYDVAIMPTPSSFSILGVGNGYDPLNGRVLVNGGTVYNYGIDMTVEKFFSNNYYFLLTGSLFESKYRGSDDILRKTEFSTGFATNFLFAYEFKFKKSSLNIGTQATWVGGRLYTPADIAASDLAGTLIEQDDLRHSEQFDDYFRMDMKFNYKINKAKVTHEIGIDLVNITGRQNVFALTYVPDNDENPNNNLREEYQLGFLPIFFYRIDF